MMMSEHLAVLLLSNTGAHLVISLGAKPIGECRVIYCSVTTVLVLLCVNFAGWVQEVFV